MPQSDAVDPDATIAIVGGGQAGAEVATQLRQNRHQGRIVLFGDENVLPYMRPPLSKAYLAGEMGADGLIYKAAVAYEKANVELRLGESVVAIDRNAKKLALAGGESLAYDRLVIAAGGERENSAFPAPTLAISFTCAALPTSSNCGRNFRAAGAS